MKINSFFGGVIKNKFYDNFSKYCDFSVLYE